MSQPQPKGRGEARYRRYRGETDERDEPESERGHLRLLRQSRDHIADGSCHRDGHTEPRRSRDRLVHGHPMQGEDHVDDRATTYAHQRGAEPDDETVADHAALAGQMIDNAPALTAQQQPG